MRLVLQNGQEYRIHFRHHRVIAEIAGKILVRNATSALAHAAACPTEERPCGALCAEGVSYCNPVDHFDKSVGRKKALARAIKEIPREIRGQIWAAYFQVVPK